MPLSRRIPKRGFASRNRVAYQVVNVGELEPFDGEVTVEGLKARGLIASTQKPVKILADGEVEKALSVTAHAFSQRAREKIEAAGGSASVVASSGPGS
jgi:large subunit ribosomal protein L15